jgi:hypothetical protein
MTDYLARMCAPIAGGSNSTGLSPRLEAKFMDDVIEYFRQACQDAKGSHFA